MLALDEIIEACGDYLLVALDIIMLSLDTPHLYYLMSVQKLYYSVASCKNLANCIAIFLILCIVGELTLCTTCLAAFLAREVVDSREGIQLFESVLAYCIGFASFLRVDEPPSLSLTTVRTTFGLV